MGDFKAKQNLDEVRKRLYDRGTNPSKVERHVLQKKEVAVPRDWNTSTALPDELASTPASSIPAEKSNDTPPISDTSPVIEPQVATTMPRRKKRTYRSIIFSLALIVLVLVVGISSAFLITGGNNISPRNIEVSLNGPFAIGGGEVLPLQIGITNQNTADIESATLIMKYPPGTRSATGTPRDLFEERLSLESIVGGETVNVPVRVVVFGEENDEKSISATVEYRLEGSSGTFFKEANPYTFKINSSPLSLSVDNDRKVASGQEVEIELLVRSNAPTEINNVLVTASYPTGFDYSSAEPEPFYGQNTWLIPTLAPGDNQTIRLRGVVLGQKDDEFVITYSVGTAGSDNQYVAEAILAEGRSEFLIERPFIDVSVSLNSEKGDVAVIRPGQTVTGSIQVLNSLPETVYDMVVKATLVGSVVQEEDIVVRGGVYDSLQNVLRWDQTTTQALRQVEPGKSNTLNFTFDPIEQSTTPTFDVQVDVFARRLAEPDSSEELIGSAVIAGRIETEVVLASQIGRNTSSFADTGPHPPVSETSSRYTVTLEIENGSNDIVDAVVTTSLPQFVSWLDEVSGAGTVVFNPVSKELSWSAGAVNANQTAQLSFQVELTPSKSQIGSVPPLLGSQRLRATDRFTGSVVRANASPLSAELSTEAGYPDGNGVVRATSEESS